VSVTDKILGAAIRHEDSTHESRTNKHYPSRQSRRMMTNAKINPIGSENITKAIYTMYDSYEDFLS